MAESQKEKFMAAHRTLHNLQARDQAYAELKEALEVAMEAADYVDDNEGALVAKRAESKQLNADMASVRAQMNDLVTEYDSKQDAYESELDEKLKVHLEQMKLAKEEHEAKIGGYKKLLVDLEQNVRQLQAQVQVEKMDAQQAIAGFQAEVMDWEDRAKQARDAARAILGG